MAVRVDMSVNVVSPRNTATVGLDRRLTVNIDAWGRIVHGGGDGGNGGGDGGGGNGHNPLPLEEGGTPGNDGPEIQGHEIQGHEIEADQVSVRLGRGNDWSPATKIRGKGQGRRWRYKGTYHGSSGESLEIAVRARPPAGHQGSGEVTHTVKVDVVRELPDIRIEDLRSIPHVNEVDVPRGKTVDFTISGSAEGNDSNIRVVRVGLDEASDRAQNLSGDWKKWEHTLTLRGFDRQDILVSAVNRVGNARSERRRVLPVDTGPPRLTLTEAPSGTIRWPASGNLTLEYGGIARDHGTGVARVQWRLGDEGRFQNATDDSNSGDWSQWSAQVSIPSMGDYVVHFLCTDRAGNEASKNVDIKVRDLTPPEVQITKPSSSPHEVLEEEGGVTVEVEGTAEDPITEVVGVEWSLNGSPFEPTNPVVDDDWSKWGFSVQLDQLDEHLIRVRATDVSGNTSEPRELIVIVMERV